MKSCKLISGIIVLSILSCMFVGCNDNTDNNSELGDTQNSCNHDYVITTVEATCLTDGYKTYYCSLCGNTYTDSYVAAFGHDYVEREQNYKCSRCGKYEDEGFTFSLIDSNSQEYQIDSITSVAVENGVVQIPQKHLGLPVTKLSAGCLYNARKTITTLHIGSNITYVGSSLFCYGGSYYQDNVTPALKSVTFDSECKNINISHTAFSFCFNLSVVKYPTGCFTSFNHDDSVGNHYLFEKTKYYSDNVKVESGLYYINELLLTSDSDAVESSVTIKSGTLLVANYVFYENTNIKTVTIPSSVIYIGKKAFANCLSLSQINYEGTKTQYENIVIEDNAFDNCKSINLSYSN